MNAYVTFKSMEGKERAVQSFMDGAFVRSLKKAICRTDYEDKMFMNTYYLDVEGADAPEMINWENLRATLG